MSRTAIAAGILVVASLGLKCVPLHRAEDEDVVTIGAYSVVREALHDGVMPAFAAKWRSETGRSVRFEESYNSSARRPERSPRGSMRTSRSSRWKGTSTCS